MGDRTRLGLWVLAAAAGLGILGDTLLRTLPWGINLTLSVWVLVGVAAALVWRGGLPLAAEVRWLLVAALFFAGSVVWRDSEPLLLLDILAVLVSLGLAATYSLEPPRPLRQSGVADYGLSLIWMGIAALLGPLPLLVSDIQWSEIPTGKRSGQAIALLRGLLIALPLVLIFGSLLTAADPVFSRLVTDVFDWDASELIAHLFWTSFWGWLVSGLLRELLLGKAVPLLRVERPANLRLGLTEIATILGLLNLLFLAFVLVQFRYFFGGAELVQATTGLTYAEYARRGFFELVQVTALVLPLLLAVHWLLPAESPRHQRLFQALAGLMVLLLLVIMASALQRMRLYVQEYGLTELRLYTTAFMFWLGLLLAWFVATVLRGRRERFAFGATVTGLAAIALLHLLNPDAVIVRTNVGRFTQSAQVQGAEPLDIPYISSLSADAVPALLAALSQLPAEQACTVAGSLKTAWLEEPPPD